MGHAYSATANPRIAYASSRGSRPRLRPAELEVLLVEAHRLQSWLLRLTGTVETLAFFAVIMPRQWMEVSHQWLGMGEMPDGAVVNFMIRQASFIYGLHGVLLWLLSLDVVRYRPLVIFTGISYALSAPVLFAIDWKTGMPWFWTVGDSVACFGVGVALLWLDWQAQQENRV